MKIYLFKHIIFLFTLFIGISFQASLNAQAFETFEISGIVSDEVETLPFSTVVLWQDSLFIHGQETGFEGQFSFTNLNAGRYTLEVRYIGYETFFETDFLLDSDIIDWNIQLALGPDLVGDLPYTIIPRPIHKLEMVSISKDSFGLSGLVLDSTGEVLPFANISLLQDKKLIAGTTSDFDGLFSILVHEAGSYVLKVEFIGFKTYQKEININSFIKNEQIILSEGQGIILYLWDGYIIPLIDLENTAQGFQWNWYDFKNFAGR